MKKLARYFKGYWHMVILAPTFKLLEAVFELITPIMVSKIIDDGIAGGDGGAVWLYGGIMIALCIAGFCFSCACQYLASRSGQAFATSIRSDMLRRINSLAFADLDQVSASGLSNRITNDVNQVQVAVSMGMRLLTRSPFLIIGATIGAALISPMIAFIFLAVACLIALTLYFIMSRTSPSYLTAARQLDTVAELAKEDLSGARVIRAYAKQQDEDAKARRQIDALTKTNLRINRIASFLNPLTQLFVNGGIIAILAVGGVFAAQGNLTAGDIFALVNYMTQIQLSLVVLANLIVNFTRASAGVSRINGILDLKPSMTDVEQSAQPIEGAPVYQCNRLTFAYHPSAAPSIQDVNFQLREGESLGIIGGTGSGKSTLINVLMHFYRPTDGSAFYRGNPIDRYTSEALRKDIALVPQKPALFSGTVRDNLIWRKADADDDELWRALETAQAKDFVDRLPEDLFAPVAQNGRNFSGGQRQRLTIARALVGSPRVLILDDSFSALDAATDSKLRKALSRLGVTSILVSQRAGSLKNCDQILVLDQGKQIALGTHSDLLKTCPLYKEIYLSQKRAKGDSV